MFQDFVFEDIFLNYAAFQVFIEADDLMWNIVIGDKTVTGILPSLKSVLEIPIKDLNEILHTTLHRCFITRVMYSLIEVGKSDEVLFPIIS